MLSRSFIRTVALSTALLLHVVVCSPATEATRRKQDNRLVLENSHLRVTIAPDQGACITSLLSIPDKRELIVTNSIVDSLVLPDRKIYGLGKVNFQVEEDDDKQTERSASWTLSSVPSANAAGAKLPDDLKHLRIAKTYELLSDSTTLRVRYQLINTGKTPLTVCLATLQTFAELKDHPVLSVPTRQGPLAFSPASKPAVIGGRTQAYLYGVPGAWSSMTARNGGGIVTCFDPRHVSFLRLNTTARQVLFARTAVSLAPGATFSTSGWLMPLSDIDHVDGAASGLACRFRISPKEADGTPSQNRLKFTDRMLKNVTAKFADIATLADDGAEDMDWLEEEMQDALDDDDESEYVPTGPIKIQLDIISAKARQVKVAWSQQSNPRGKWQQLSTTSATLAAGKAKPISMSFTPKHKGTLIIRAKIIENGDVLARFDHPIIEREASGFFLPQVPEKEGDVYTGFRRDLWVPSTKVERPHVRLGHPLARGPIKMLFATLHWCSRGLVEVQHRLDVEVDSVIGRAYYGLEGNTLQASHAEVTAMRQFLNRPHEVIVMAVLGGSHFPVDILDEIIRQVDDEGVGLVLYFCPDEHGELEPVRDALARPNKDFQHPQNLPAGLKCGKLGKGRVVLVPGKRQYARPDWYGNSETQVQQFLQAIVWAARGEPDVRIDPAFKRTSVVNSKLAAQPFVIRLENRAKTPFTGTIRLTPRRDLLTAYPFYNTGSFFAYRPVAGWEDAAAPIQKPVTLPAGRRVAASLKVPMLPACHYDFDVQVLDKAGRVVSWRRHPLKLTGSPGIKAVEFVTTQAGRSTTVDLSGPTHNAAFSAASDDELRVSCKITEPGATKRARLQGFDPWGRLIFDRTTNIQLAGEGARAVFTQPLHSCIHLICIVRLSLLDGQSQELAEQRLFGLIDPRADRLPALELRGYAEVRVANDVTGYHVRIGGEGYQTLAWHNSRTSGYGGYIPMAKAIRAPGFKALAMPDETTISVDFEKVQEEDNLGDSIDEEVIDPKAGWYRVPCFNNPDDKEKIMDSARRSCPEGKSLYPHKGFAVDEFWYTKEYDANNTVSHFRRAFIPQKEMNICRCEHCAGAFRAYVTEVFAGNLTQLNSEWGTQFKKWTDLEIPLTVTNNVTPPDPATWPYVLAHRDFINAQVADLLIEFDQILKRGHPDSETGLSGLWKTGINTGIDIYRLAGSMIYNMLYSDVDLWTDFGKSQAVSWTGYSRKYRLMQGSVQPWRSLNAGHTAIGYYGKWTNPMHRGDFTFHPEPLTFFNKMRDMEDTGAARLVVGRRYRDPIALYYNPRDIYLAQLEDWHENPPRFVARMRNGGRSYSEFCYSIAGTYRGLLKGQYLQPFWTAYGHLSEGHFGNRFGTPKLLLLPYAQCLSKKQAETLRRFVDQGGVLVGDIHTGRRNEHGRLLPAGQLDDVFGIRVTQKDRQIRVRADKAGKRIPVSFTEKGGGPFSLSFAAVGPGDVEAKTATALASYDLAGKKQPAFLVNDFGSGKAVYLNFIPSGYVAVELAGVEGEERTEKEIKGIARQYFQSFFNVITEMAGLVQPMRFTGRGLGSTRFGDGDLSYIGLVSGRGLEALRLNYEIAIPEPRHVYSVYQRKYLGLTDTFTIQLDEATRRAGDIVSLLPYKVDGIEVRMQREVRAGESLKFTASIQPEKAGAHRHVIAAHVVDPAGNIPRHYRHNAETVNGVAHGQIDTAVNDTPGTWTLTLTDAASGVRREIQFKLTAR